jgi:hypothetical protein
MMSNQENDRNPNNVSNQDMHEFERSGGSGGRGQGDVDIEPSEMPEDDASNTKNQSGDPGRTPGKAEGDRETVEADLKENA